MADGKIAKLPPSETVATTCFREDGAVFLITSKPVGGGLLYTLYRSEEGGYIRLCKGPSPLELEKNAKIW